MQYSTILEASQETFEQIINSCNGFEVAKVLEAIRERDYDQGEIELMTCEVRETQCKLKKNLVALQNFATVYNKQYATDNNKCYSTAKAMCQKMIPTIAGVKKIFKRLCPINRKKLVDAQGNPVKASVFTHSHLANVPYSHDLFDMESFPDYVQELCYALCDFCTDLRNIFQLCNTVLAKEDDIRTHPDKCTQIYKENYDKVAKNSRDTIKTINNLGGNLQMDAMSERKNGCRSLQQMICDCFHLFNPSQFQMYVIYDVISEGKKEGLTTTEALLWKDNHQMALDARFVIENFDKLAPKGRMNTKEGKHHVKSSYVAMLEEWTGIKGSGNESKFVRYFTETYKGIYLPPSISGTSNAKNYNPYTQEEYQAFTEKLKKLLSKKSGKAISISMNETA